MVGVACSDAGFGVGVAYSDAGFGVGVGFVVDFGAGFQSVGFGVGVGVGVAAGLGVGVGSGNGWEVVLVVTNFGAHFGVGLC